MNASLKVLLDRVVDYAGLFPPAELMMREAVANYASYVESEHAWMLGRFILPATRLDEFAQELGRLVLPESHPTWFLSVLGSGDLHADYTRISQFDSSKTFTPATQRCVINAFEFKTSSLADVHQLAQFKESSNSLRLKTRAEAEVYAAAGVETYCEVALVEGVDELLKQIGETGAGAKVRTGGTTAEMFPSTSELAHFIHLCACYGVPFKATAGLHHPLRAIHRLTYQANSPTAMMHGFLNVFIASAFARAGATQHTLVEILEAQDPVDFRFTDDGIVWRDRCLNLHEIENARGEFAVSFGSCSFTEPLDDLKALNLL